MSLIIIGTFDRGKPNLERVIFEAAAPTNLSYYVVMHSTRLGDGVTAGSRLAFWFPTYEVAIGQRVQLFTGSNLDPKTPNPGNFFWGLKQTILNNPNDCLILVQAATWQTVAEPLAQMPGLPGLWPRTG